MKFISTRGEATALSFSDAVATGLAPDGGLYLPESMPDISGKLAAWESLTYPELCLEFLKLFADIDEATLRTLVDRSYERFTHPDIAPLVELDAQKGLYVLELFHGPTLAFKDFALQLLGNLYEHQIEQTGVTINVLGATSGDTGSAAIHGLLGKHGVNIFILYPDGRVSPLQERQMTTTGADNVFPLSIAGTFDDGQHIVKDLFGDVEFRERHRLSAINSINLARILAQCVYYIWAWLRLPEASRANVEFVVPTGNFGNILAGWMAHKMGLPAGGFRVATNQNDILHKLFQTGVYEVSDVHPSLAPSMDIQVASNFERFLYYAEHGNPARVREVMKTFKATGRYAFASLDRDIFTSSHTTDDEIRAIVKDVHARYGYVVDPHTACGFGGDAAKGDYSAQVVLSTAHPAKFPDTIVDAIGIEPKADALEVLKARKTATHKLPAETDAVRAFMDKHGY